MICANAYYSVILEIVLGPLLPQTEREALLEGANMDVLRKQTVLVSFRSGHCLFNDLPLPQDLVSIVREWQRLAWYLVEGSPLMIIHKIGVKPRDPTADVLFAFAVHRFHQKLLSDLRLDNLIETVPLKGKGILSVPKPEVQIDIGAPTFMDDVVIPINNPCPVSLIIRSIRSAQILDSTAAEFGFVIQHGEG